MTSNKSLAAICTGLAAAGFASTASAAPRQLLNKTVTVSYSVSAPARGADGSTLNGSRSSTRTIYISNQGRIFARVNRYTGRTSQQKEAGPETSTLRFAGNSLVGVLKFESGASLLTISFDSSFQSCTAELIAGGENGKPIVFKGMNGVMYTTTGKMQFSGVSCSIREGNPFAE